MNIKLAPIFLCLFAALIVVSPIYYSNANSEQNTVSTTALISQYSENVLKACPIFWEPVGARVDPDQRNTNLWADDAEGRAAFIGFLREHMGDDAPDDAGLNTMANDPLTVATECAAQKIQLMQSMVVDLPVNVLQSIQTISQHLGATVDTTGQPSGQLNLGQSFSDGFLVGDVRMTGRREAAPGWLFLKGQTVSNNEGSADLSGEVYKELFELAKYWAPNTGNESFDNGDVITLPDGRGRTVAGLDASGAVVSNTEASQLAGTYGSAEHLLTSAEMPVHNHSMSTAGHHGHSMGYGGHHTHSMRIYKATPAFNSGNSVLRTGAHGNLANSTITSSINWSGNHRHSISAAGNHVHSISNTGGNQAHNNMQPTLFLNMEMKYADAADVQRLAANQSSTDPNNAQNEDLDPELGLSKEKPAESCDQLKLLYPDSWSSQPYYVLDVGDSSLSFFSVFHVLCGNSALEHSIMQAYP